MGHFINQSLRLLEPCKRIIRLVFPNFAVRRLETVWKRLQVRRILAEPDRAYLSEHIAPRLVALGPATLYFVGVAAYTRPILEQLKASDLEIWTSDIDPGKRCFGIEGHHVVADVTEAKPAVLPNSFDIIVINGVFGYGVNTLEQSRAALAGLKDTMAHSGILLVGWNVDRCPDLEPLFAEVGLVHTTLADLPSSTTFATSTHRYDLLKSQ